MLLFCDFPVTFFLLHFPIKLLLLFLLTFFLLLFSRAKLLPFFYSFISVHTFWICSLSWMIFIQVSSLFLSGCSNVGCTTVCFYKCPGIQLSIFQQSIVQMSSHCRNGRCTTGFMTTGHCTCVCSTGVRAPCGSIFAPYYLLFMVAWPQPMNL